MNRREFLALSGGSIVGAWGGRGRAQNLPLRSVIEAAMVRETIPGLAFSVVRDGVLTESGAYGVRNLETQLPVTAETTFEVASLTKPVFAYCVHQLVRDGGFVLDAPLSAILEPPFATDPTVNADSMTARHILSHTSGLPNWYRGKRDIHVRYAPGESFRYSGMGYVYLQQVVEKMTNTAIDDLLSERVFDPLGMSSASLVWRDDYGDTLAFGHVDGGRPVRREYSEPNVAWSLVCTAADYGKFLCAMLDPPELHDTLLNAVEVQRMLEPQVEVDGNLSWGLGWGIERHRDGDTFWQWGNNNNTYHAFAIGEPSIKAGVVILTNSGGGLRVCREIVNHVLPSEHPAFDYVL